MLLSDGKQLRRELGQYEKIIKQAEMMYRTVVGLAEENTEARRVIMLDIPPLERARLIRKAVRNSEQMSSLADRHRAKVRQAEVKWETCMALMGDFMRSGRSDDDLRALLKEFPAIPGVRLD